MKYFIISDVHGHYTEMIQALSDAGFDQGNENHHLVIAGDLFDRGTENIKVLYYVHKLLDEGSVTLIKGNHDEFFHMQRDFIWNYQHNGFDKTVDEFLGDTDARTLTPINVLRTIFDSHPELSQVLNSMVDKLIIGKYVITHAGLDMNGVPDNWNNVPRWISSKSNEDDGKIYIFGHWHAHDLTKRFLLKNSHEPFIYKNYIGIDSAVALYEKMFVYTIEEEN